MLYARYVPDEYRTCPPFNVTTFPQATTAYALKKAWPEITLHIVSDAGHSSREPGTTKLLVEVRRPGSVFHCPKAHKNCLRPQTSSLTSERLNW
jgi:hypothetical protein